MSWLLNLSYVHLQASLRIKMLELKKLNHNPETFVFGCNLDLQLCQRTLT